MVEPFEQDNYNVTSFDEPKLANSKSKELIYNPDID